MMKKLIVIAMACMMLCSGCKKEEKVEVLPETSKMKSICEFATLECHYHNVAKYNEKDAEKFLFFWSKDKKFWIEYTSTVKVGIDASKLELKVSGDKVKVSMPKAKIINNIVNEESLKDSSYIKESGSADIVYQDELEAIDKAQKEVEKKVKNDENLLRTAQDRAENLIKQYVNNIGKATGKTYKVVFNYIED